MSLHLDLKDFFEGINGKFLQPPGTITYEGEYKDERFHGQVILYDTKLYEALEFDGVDELERILENVPKSEDKTFWINIIGLSDGNAIHYVGNHFRIPELFLEDIVHVSKHSKLDIKDEQLFSTLQMIYMKEKMIITETLSIFFAHHTVITFQEQDGDAFDVVRRTIKENTGNVREKKADFLYYLIMDALVDNYLSVVLALGYRIDLLEDMIIDSSEIDMREIYTLRKQLLLLRTTVFPLQNIKEVLTELGDGLFSDGMELHFDDIKDHMNQLVNNISVYRETVNNLFETHMLNVSNDMNKIMTTLTIFSAIFIPMSFMAGVFGMNFQHMPGSAWPYSFFLFMSACFILGFGMIVFFKKKKWF